MVAGLELRLDLLRVLARVYSNRIVTISVIVGIEALDTIDTPMQEGAVMKEGPSRMVHD